MFLARWRGRTPRLSRRITVGMAVVLFAALAAGCLVWFERRAAAPDLPNVVLILTDDERFDGNWVMSSLKRLAERGVTFNQDFDTTPVCCPSRASIMTGLYAHHHGVLTNHLPLGSVARFDDHSTLATWLHDAGVRTGLVGRYLNGYDTTYVPPGWDYWFAIWQSNENYSNYYHYRVTDNGTMRFFGNEAKEYSTRVVGRQALDFLSRDKDRPFMLMIPTRAPHGPATPDRIDAGKFKDANLPLPPSYDQEDVSDKPRATRETPRLTPEQKSQIEVFRREQLETLLGVDRMIDSVVESLRADGRLERTWIIFTSDNGLMMGEHRWDVHKDCAYEECVRVPLVVIPPGGLPAGRTDDHVVANIDLAPTVAAIMGVKAGAPMDGQSLLPLIEDPSATWRDGLVLEVWGNAKGESFHGIRTADKKYVLYDSGEEELYDERADPYEMHNLAGLPALSDEKARLASRLEALMAHEPRPPEPR
jgi:N-acetylglucosamine-6-sulfatase